jgi:hypothetical protein
MLIGPELILKTMKNTKSSIFWGVTPYIPCKSADVSDTVISTYPYVPRHEDIEETRVGVPSWLSGQLHAPADLVLIVVEAGGRTAELNTTPARTRTKITRYSIL